MKSICIKTWVLKNGETAFDQGKVYQHAKTEHLAIIGNNYIMMFLSESYYKEYFKKAE